MIRSSLTNHEMPLREKLWQINWTMVLLIIAIAFIGFAMLYSAAKGNIDPWASRQMGRFGIGLALMFVIALVDIHFWMRYALFMYLVGWDGGSALAGSRFLSIAALGIYENSGDPHLGAAFPCT
jgi:hypothetical protein